MLIEAVMDTAVHGPEVDTVYLLETESGEDTDGGGGQKLPFYQDIASCNIEVSTVMYTYECPSSNAVGYSCRENCCVHRDV